MSVTAPAPLPRVAAARTYADTCVERESGDIAGTVVTVRRSGAGVRIAIYWSDGQLRGPARATATLARGERLRFVARTSEGGLRFAGRLTPDRLAGRLALPWERIAIPVSLSRRPVRASLEPTVACR